MAEHSIEFLGQKFSYPTTWQGVSAVFVVCAAITTLAIMLSPEQIESIGIALGTDSERQFESELVAINEKLSEENANLKDQVFRLTEAANIPESEKREIVSQVTESENAISQAYTQAIEKQQVRKDMISAAIPRLTQEQQMALSVEEARLTQQIDKLQYQREIQQQR